MWLFVPSLCAPAMADSKSDLLPLSTICIGLADPGLFAPGPASLYRSKLRRRLSNYFGVLDAGPTLRRESVMLRNPSVVEAFRALAPDVPFPWQQGSGPDEDKIVDANGFAVAEVFGPPEDRRQAIAAILCAVNTCAGFKAVVNDVAEGGTR